MKSPQLSRKSLTGFLLLDFFTTLGLLLSYWHLVKIDSENTFLKYKILEIDDMGRKLPQFHVKSKGLTPGTGPKLRSPISWCWKANNAFKIRSHVLGLL